MNHFSFSGMTAISFGLDRIKQLADDITAPNGSRAPVVLISDAGVAQAGILAQVKSIVERAGHAIGHALATIAAVPHGRAVAIAMDALIAWNEAACPDHRRIKRLVPQRWPN
jgi:alcohol dehydrogenase class IV